MAFDGYKFFSFFLFVNFTIPLNDVLIIVIIIFNNVSHLSHRTKIYFCGKLKSGVDLLFLRIYNILQCEYELFNLILHYILVKLAFFLEWKISFTFSSFFFLSTLEYLYERSVCQRKSNKFDPCLKLTFQDMINGLVIFIGKSGSVPIPTNWLPFFFPFPRCQIGNREIIFFFLPSPLEIYEVEPNEFETKTRLSCNESTGLHYSIDISLVSLRIDIFTISLTRSDLSRFLTIFSPSIFIQSTFPAQIISEIAASMIPTNPKIIRAHPKCEKIPKLPFPSLKFYPTPLG